MLFDGLKDFYHVFPVWKFSKKLPNRKTIPDRRTFFDDKSQCVTCRIEREQSALPKLTSTFLEGQTARNEIKISKNLN